MLSVVALTSFVGVAQAESISTSSGFSPAVIVEAFRNWPTEDKSMRFANQTQSSFFKQFGAMDLRPYKGILWGMGGRCGEVNTFLAENGFPDVRLDDGPDCVGAAGVFKKEVKHKSPGTETVMDVPSGRYQGAKFSHFEFARSRGGDVILRIPSEEEGWSLNISPVSKHYADLNAYTHVQKMVEDMKQIPSREGYTHLELPAAKMRVDVDVKWVLNLRIGGDKIDQAFKKVVFEFDHVSAKGEAAFGAGATRSMGAKTHEKVFRIDGSYLAWFSKDGMNEPALVVYVAQDGWIKK
ncbi:hypothetical protein EBR66_03750 [bacterium]|nr:hypothetical protein [bacterium]